MYQKITDPIVTQRYVMYPEKKTFLQASRKECIIKTNFAIT